MPYTTASGVQIPVGTDVFAPTTQFKTWADKSATAENRYIVADDTARLALAAPVLREGISCFVKATGTEWTYNGSSWDKGTATSLRLDFTNSVVNTITQIGIGKVAGAAAAQVTASVTFPVSFASIPVITGGYVGVRTTGAFNPASLADFAPNVIGKVYGASTTGLTVLIHRTDGSNLTTGWDFYYSWTATGVPA